MTPFLSTSTCSRSDCDGGGRLGEDWMEAIHQEEIIWDAWCSFYHPCRRCFSLQPPTTAPQLSAKSTTVFDSHTTRPDSETRPLKIDESDVPHFHLTQLKPSTLWDVTQLEVFKGGYWFYGFSDEIWDFYMLIGGTLENTSNNNCASETVAVEEQSLFVIGT